MPLVSQAIRSLSDSWLLTTGGAWGAVQMCLEQCPSSTDPQGTDGNRSTVASWLYGQGWNGSCVHLTQESHGLSKNRKRRLTKTRTDHRSQMLHTTKRGSPQTCDKRRRAEQPWPAGRSNANSKKRRNGQKAWDLKTIRRLVLKGNSLRNSLGLLGRMAFRGALHM